MIDNHGKAGARGIYLEGLRQRRTTLCINKSWVVGRIQGLEGAERSNHGRLIDQTYTDRIRADHTGIDIRICANAKHRVEPGHNSIGRIAKRIDTGCVFQLVQSDHISVQPSQSGDELVTLALELKSLIKVRAAAFHALGGTALVIERIAGRVVGGDEEVQRVHGCDTQ